MKRLILLLSCAIFGVVSVSAHDFAIKNPRGDDGDSIYFNILTTPAGIENSPDVLSLAVTYPGNSVGSQSDFYKGIVEIPATVTHNGVVLPVTSIGVDAFRNCRNITELTIPEHVDSVDVRSSRMSDISNLEVLHWHPHRCVVSSRIGNLSGTKLREVHCRRTVPGRVFNRCASLKSVVFGAECDSIASEALQGTGIESVSLPTGVDRLYIGSSAFADSRLQSLTVPDVPLVFALNAFDGCSSLQSVVWNAGSYSFDSNGSESFFDGSSLKKVTIGENVRKLPVLAEIPALDTVIYNAREAVGGSLYQHPDYVSPATSVEFGDSVTSIPPKAFWNFRNVTEVQLPESVVSLGCNAFYLTTSITGNNAPFGSTVWLDRASCDTWSNVYLYAQYDGVELFGAFPGMELTGESGGYLSYSFPEVYCSYYSNSPKLRFSDGTASRQTVDMIWPGTDVIYILPSQDNSNISPSVVQPDGFIPDYDDKLSVRLTDTPLPSAITVQLMKPAVNAEYWQHAFVGYKLKNQADAFFEMTPSEDGGSFSFVFEEGAEFDADVYFYNYDKNNADEYYPGRRWNLHVGRPSCPMVYTATIDPDGTGYTYAISAVEVTPDFLVGPKKFSVVDYKAPYAAHIFNPDLGYLCAKGNKGVIDDGWAVLPVVDASDASHLTLSFRHSFSKSSGIADMSVHCNVLVSTDGVQWDTVPVGYPEYGTGAENYREVAVSLSLDRYISPHTRIAFAYYGTTECNLNWNIKDVHITSALCEEFGTETGIVQVAADFPESAMHFYDVGGTGKMDYFSSKISGAAKRYNLYGRFQGITNFGGSLLSIDNIDRSGTPELVSIVNDYDESPSLNISSLSGGKMAGIFPSGRFYNSKYTQLFDADGDGLTDIYANYQKSVHSIFYQQPDGSFIERKIETVTDPEEIRNAMFAQYGANPVARPSVNFSGASLAKAPRPSAAAAPVADGDNAMHAAAPVFADDPVVSIDLNMDGLPDLLNLYNGNAFFSLGDNRYYYGDFNGRVTAKDVSGDGIPDFIVYNESEKKVRLIIYEGEDSFSDRILFQNLNITDVWCYDFDGDGDIDILLPFDYTTSSAYSYLVFFENQGNNTFRKRERSSPDIFRFVDCNDFDNDGEYEVVGIKCVPIPCAENSGQQRYMCRYEYFLIECDSFKFTVPETPFFSYTDEQTVYFGSSPDFSGDCRFVSGDFDNDGQTEFWLAVNGESDPFRGRFLTETVNAAPARMAAPTFVEDAASGTLRVEWQPGTDATASACDLSYAMRIGTAPGLGDIWYAHANADGSRRRPGEGNAASSLFQMVKTYNWLPGNYYIAVQAVDPQGRGGEWSDETVYNKKTLTAALAASSAELTTVDTVTVVLSVPYNPDYTYQWAFGDDAVVVSQDTVSARVTYTKDGTKTLSVSVTDTTGRTSFAETVIDVFAVKMTSKYTSYDIRGITADFDMDGTMEFVGSFGGTKGLHINDGNGNFSKAPGTFNSDLQPGNYMAVLDFNMDGLPDFIGNTNKGNVFINLEDLDFEYLTETFTTDGSSYYNDLFNMKNWVDINGDGFMDFCTTGYTGNIYVNQGDNLTFNALPVSFHQNESIIALDDLNADGIPDAFVRGGNDGKRYFYHLNNGGGTFGNSVEVLALNGYVYSNNIILEDMNGDGYNDIVYLGYYEWSSNETETAFILLGGPDGQFAEKVDLGMVLGEKSQVLLFDFDNNGYIDIQSPLSLDLSQGKNSITYFYPGMQWRTSLFGNVGYYTMFDYCGDINGDGRPDGLEIELSTKHTNTAPAAPANVRAVQDAGGVTLLWDAADDAETPATMMRYNVSLKRAGMSGDNSYVISPLNEGNDAAAIVPGYPYIRATRMSLPVDRFISGEQYEFKVQAIDLWGEHSPFSGTYTFEVSSVVNIIAPDETCVGSVVEVTYSGTETGIPEWELDGGTLVSQDGNSVSVIWTVPGIRQVTVTVGGISGTKPVIVRENIDMSFTLPSLVLAGAEVPFTLPAVFAQTDKIIGIRTSDLQDMSGSAATLVPTFGGGKVAIGGVAENKNKIVVERRGSSLEARVIFNGVAGNTAWLELYCVDPVCGEVSHRCNVQLSEQNITPEISIVTVDAASGHNKVVWDAPADLPSALFTDMVVFREEGATGNFVEIGRVPLENGEFIDLQSDPTVRKNRYRIALMTTYGGFSTMSEVHGSVHVMLNRGMGGNINIMWSQYEGGIVSQYSIMRGTSPDNLSVLATASGYESSYTDKTA